MDLNAIKFNVETSALDESIKKIDQVATALGKMSSKVKEVTTAKTNAAKADKEAIENATALAKLKVQEAKATEAAAKATAAEAKAKQTVSAASSKAVEASKEQVKVSDKVTEALSGTDRVLAKQALSMQILRGEIVNTADGVAYLGAGFTKSQAGMLANLQLLGATGKEMQTLARSFEDYNKITGLNTFDKSASGISKMKKELVELTQINSVITSGLSLTRDEIVNYTRDLERLAQQQVSEGHSAEWLAERQKELKQSYLTTSVELNRLRAESMRMEEQAKRQASAEIKAANDRARAQEFVAKEMNRVNAAFIAATGEDRLNVSTSNRLVKMEQALKLSGDSAEIAAGKIAKYKAQLMALEKASSDKAVDNISRALGPQITDITVGLATGQSLMTVLLQQGGQLRDQMALAGVAADQMGAAIRRAGSEMVSSVWATGKGVIGGIAGAFLDIGRNAGASVAMASAHVIELGTSLLLTKNQQIAFNEAVAKGNGPLGKFLDFLINSRASATIFASVIGLSAVALIALGVAAYKADKAVGDMNKSLILTGASLGVSRSGAVALAESFSALSGSAIIGIDALAEMSKQGGMIKEQFASVAESAYKMGAVFDLSVQDIVKQYAEINKDPVAALIRLQKETGLVNEATLAHVESLRKQGDSFQAVKIASEEMGRVHSRVTSQALKEMTLWEGAAVGLKWAFDGVGKKLMDVMLGFTQTNLAKDVAEANAEVDWLLSQGYTLQDYTLRDALKAQRDANQKLANEQKKEQARQRRSLEAGYRETANEVLKGASSVLTQESMKTMSFTDYVEKAWELKIPDAKAREWARSNTNAFQEFEKATRIEYEKTLKKEKGTRGRAPQSPGLFDIGVEKGKADNALNEVKKFYDAQSAELENSYKSNQITLGNYLSKEFTLIENQANKKREIQANLIEQLSIQEQSDLRKLEAWKSTLTETEDKKRADKMIEDTKDRYQKTRAAAQSSIIGLVDDTKKAVAKAMQELVKLSQESAKLFEDFRKGISEREEARALELEDARLSINLSGEQLAAEKARIAEMRNVSEQLLKQASYVEKLKSAYEDLTTAGRKDEASRAFKDWQAAQERLAQMKTDSETAAGKAAVDAVTKYQLEEYAKLKDGIADALTTALFQGGKAGSKKLREVLIAELRKPITVVINAVANVITGGISSLLGISGASAAGISGNAGGLLTGASGLKSIYDAISGGFGAMAANVGSTIASFGMKFGSAAIQSFGEGIAMSGTGIGPGGVPIAGNGVGGMAGTTQAGYYLGNAAMIAGGLFGGQSLGRMISGGYSAFGGGSGSSAVNTGQVSGTAIGAILGGPIGAAIGALLGGIGGGLINRLFGKKLDKLGIEGTFSGESFTGSRYEYYKGGVFRSDKTKRKPLDQETKDALGQSFAALKNQFTSLAEWFGTSTVDEVEAYTKKIKLNFKGKSQKQINEMFTKLFGSMSEDMAQLVLAESVQVQKTKKSSKTVAVNWQRFSKEGETAVQTLERLKTNLLGVNQVLDTLGMDMLDISLVSGDLSSSLSDVFGGLDKLQNATANYYEKFYSEEEKLATATRQLTATFTSMGLTLPATREAFKDLVAAQDLTTASGQLTFAALIGLSDVFYEITNPLEEATQKMKEFTNSILEYINSLSMTEGEASQNYAYAQAVFKQQLGFARGGDQSAMDNITSYSDKLLELAKSSAGSALEYETILGSVKAELLGLVTGNTAGSILTAGLTPSTLSPSGAINTASQVVEQTATTQELLLDILDKLTEMQSEDRAEGVQNVINLSNIAKIFKRIDNGESIRVLTVVD